MTRKDKSITPLYEAVVDSSRQQGKALKVMGINKDEITSGPQMRQAMLQLTGMVFFGVKQFESILKSKFENMDTEVVDAATKKLTDALKQWQSVMLRQAGKLHKDDGAGMVKHGSGPYRDLRTGYSDDPNPETRGKHRSYRSGE